MNQFNVFLKNVERDLDVGLHEQLAEHVRYLATTQSIHYEKLFLILLGRNHVTSITRRGPDMFYLVMGGFIADIANPDLDYNPMFVHRTLLVFLRDWFVASHLEHHAVEHLMKHESVQKLISLSPGWQHMTMDWKLLAVLVTVYDQATYLSWLEYLYEIDEQFIPFWQSISIMEFYGSCIALRVLIIQKQEEYIHLFQHIDWDDISDRLLVNLLLGQAAD